MRVERLLTTLIILGLLAGCASLEEEDETKGWSVSKFYSEASEALSEGDYDKAIRYYEGLEARYPFGPYATQSQLDVIYAHYKNEEPESAIAAADRFIKLYPTNAAVDYAFYMKGVANYNRGSGLFSGWAPTDDSQRDPGAALDSFNDFAELVKKFPRSKYAADARKRLEYLRNNLAKNELHVARYYMRKGAYLAAVNRANTVVERYQRTTAVKPALELMIAGYNKLGMTDLAADSQRVFDLNEQQDRFAIEAEVRKSEKGLWRRTWEYLGFDEN